MNPLLQFGLGGDQGDAVQEYPGRSVCDPVCAFDSDTIGNPALDPGMC